MKGLLIFDKEFVKPGRDIFERSLDDDSIFAKFLGKTINTWTDTLFENTERVKALSK